MRDCYVVYERGSIEKIGGIYSARRRAIDAFLKTVEETAALLEKSDDQPTREHVESAIKERGYCLWHYDDGGSIGIQRRVLR